jgi:MoxR-like ATPase
LEILAFLRSPGGRSLLVKGASGAGKTMFALQLAEEVRDAFLPHRIDGSSPPSRSAS